MPVSSIEDSLVASEYSVRQADLNGYKLLHGGRLLTLADEVGFLAAHRFCNRDCLTVAVHRARFHQSARRGDVIRLQAKVALTGKSSIWVPVSVLNSGGECLMDAIIVYTAVDGRHRPVHIGKIRAITDAEKALQQRMQHLKAGVDGDKH